MQVETPHKAPQMGVAKLQIRWTSTGSEAGGFWGLWRPWCLMDYIWLCRILVIVVVVNGLVFSLDSDGRWAALIAPGLPELVPLLRRASALSSGWKRRWPLSSVTSADTCMLSMALQKQYRGDIFFISRHHFKSLCGFYYFFFRFLMKRKSFIFCLLPWCWTPIGHAEDTWSAWENELLFAWLHLDAVLLYFCLWEYC